MLSLVLALEVLCVNVIIVIILSIIISRAVDPAADARGRGCPRRHPQTVSTDMISRCVSVKVSTHDHVLYHSAASARNSLGKQEQVASAEGDVYSYSIVHDIIYHCISYHSII